MSDADDIRDLETEIIASTTSGPSRMARWTTVIALMALFGALAVWATSTSYYVGLADRVDELEQDVEVLQRQVDASDHSAVDKSDDAMSDTAMDDGSVMEDDPAAPAADVN